MIRNLLITISILLCSVNTKALEVMGSAQPKIAEQTAIAELKCYLGKTANSLTVAGHKPKFYIGDTDKASSIGLTSSKLEDESWVIKSVGNDIIIIGGGTRGTLYGVYNFIENQLGVRWWNPFEEYIPPKKDLVFDAFDLTGKPFFSMRNIYRNSQFPDDQGKWAARNRLNQDGDSIISKKFGGTLSFGSPYHVHTIACINGYMPTEKYFAAHPEYFSLIKGKRVGDQFKGQVCFTNPDILPIFIAKLKANIIKDEATTKAKGIDAPTIYDISINDNKAFCQCKNCQAAIAKDNASGVMLQFINKLARELKAFRPNYYLQTAAYFSTLKAPKITHAEDNVIVRLCDTNSVLHEDILAASNRPFRDIVKSWSKVAKHLAIWEYAITYDDSMGLPYPSEYTYSTNWKFYADNGVMGFIVEHEGPDCGDIYDQKVYYEAKLLENPKLDFAVLQNDFYSKYYGKAGVAVHQYRERLRKAAFANKATMAYFSPTSTGFKYIDLQTMIDCQKIMDRAETMVKNDKVLLHRVRRARYGIDLALGYTLIGNYKVAAKATKMDPKVFNKMVKVAQARIISTWEETSSRLLNCGASLKKIKKLKNMMKAQTGTTKTPKIFQGKNVQIYDPSSWQVHTANAKLVKNVNSNAGFAYQINTNKSPKYYHCNQPIGIYDTKTKKVLAGATIIIDKAKDGFQWYKISNVKLHNPSYLYATGSWTMQFRLDVISEMYRDQSIDIYVEIKLNGPAFKKAGKNSIEIGSVAIVL